MSDAFRSTYEEAGFTQTRLAGELQARGFVNVEQAHVSRWARGMNTPPLEVLPAVEEACRVPLGTILRRAGYVADTAAMSVSEAIAADPYLDDEGRAALRQLYRVLTRQAAQPVGPVDLNDPDEAELWSLDRYTEAERWAFIQDLRAARAGAEIDAHASEG